MYEPIKPLPMALYKELTALKVVTLKLERSGGSDEGYLESTLTDEDEEYVNAESLDFNIESWWMSDYSGAGDGSDYGDNVTYNLDKGTATGHDWFTQRVYEDAKRVYEDADIEDLVITAKERE